MLMEVMMIVVMTMVKENFGLFYLHNLERKIIFVSPHLNSLRLY
jgi:hypothetical protein